MSNVPEHLLEIGASFEQTYTPVLDFHGWRVAMLRHFDKLAPENFQEVERHRETNEVFILTAGQADLIICDDEAGPTDPDAHIILFERTNTAVENSDYAQLDRDTIAGIKALFTTKIPSTN